MTPFCDAGLSQGQIAFHKLGDNAPCFVSNIPYMTVFGGIQILLSQIPAFGELWFLSIVAAVMSFTYSFIGLGLGISVAAGIQLIYVILFVTKSSHYKFLTCFDLKIG